MRSWVSRVLVSALWAAIPTIAYAEVPVPGDALDVPSMGQGETLEDFSFPAKVDDPAEAESALSCATVSETRTQRALPVGRAYIGQARLWCFR